MGRIKEGLLVSGLSLGRPAHGEPFGRLRTGVVEPRSGAIPVAVVLSEEKNLIAETLRFAQDDMIRLRNLPVETSDRNSGAPRLFGAQSRIRASAYRFNKASGAIARYRPEIHWYRTSEIRAGAGEGLPKPTHR